MSIRRTIILALAVAFALCLRVKSARTTPAIAASSPDESHDVATVFRALSSPATTTQSGKPWLSDPSAFLNANGDHWIIGRSRKPCLSGNEALESARVDATNAIADLLRTKLARFRGDRDRIASRIRSEIETGRLDADTSTEHFTRPYGTIWTGSVLIDVSPEKLDPLIAQFAGELRHQRASTMRLRFGAGFITTIAWSLYFALNALTKGYFTRPLRFGALAVTVLAFMLVM